MKDYRKESPKKFLTQIIRASPFADYLTMEINEVLSDHLEIQVDIDKWKIQDYSENDVCYGFFYGIIDTAAFLSIQNKIDRYKHLFTLNLNVSHLDVNFMVNKIFLNAKCVQITNDYAYSFVKIYLSNRKIIANANVSFIVKEL